MRLIRSSVELLRPALGALTPTPGTTEGAVMLGLILLSAGCIVAGAWPLAFAVPGALLVFLGSLPILRRR